MEIIDRPTILKYLQITLLSYSRICHFIPEKAPTTRFKARFQRLSRESLQIRLDDIPNGIDGSIVFFSYTFIFRFRTRLHANADTGIYSCSIPSMIETFDRRKYARLKFESRENKIVTIHNKSLNQSITGILADLSAGGLGFIVTDLDLVPKKGDLIMTALKLRDLEFQVMAEVAQVRNDFVGAVFLEKSTKFQLELNNLIKLEIDWRSEHMLKNLKQREEMLKVFHQSQEKSALEQKKLADKLNFLDPFLDHFCDSFKAVTDLDLTYESAQYRESTSPAELKFLYLHFYFNTDLLFIGYFSAPQDVLYKLALPLFGDQLSGKGFNESILLEVLGKQIVARSNGPENNNRIFTYADASVHNTNKRLLSDLLQQHSIRIDFQSPIGTFSLMLMAENLEESLNLCTKAKAREFITMEKMDLIEPISYSTLKVFSEFLKLDIREKSVTTREQLMPRFEISILLDIFFEDVDGKVILNLSKRLALKIYELLLNEKIDEFNADVKDAVAELTNMITGNAKSQFEDQGIYYKIGTPVVLESREGVIIYAKNMNFLSSVYWTSEGFFELSFSFFKK